MIIIIDMIESGHIFYCHLSFRQSKGHWAALRHLWLTSKHRKVESALSRQENTFFHLILTSIAWRSEVNLRKERILRKSSGGRWQGSILEFSGWLSCSSPCFGLLEALNIFILCAPLLLLFLFLFHLSSSQLKKVLLDDDGVLRMPCCSAKRDICSFVVNIQAASLLFVIVSRYYIQPLILVCL